MRSGFTIDGASEIDPLVAEGPPLPVKNFRPAIKQRRVLIIEDGALLMADLASGRIGPWQNGPELTVPMVSLPFSLAGMALLQVQVLRDTYKTAAESTLASITDGSVVIDVVETVAGKLVIRSATGELASCPIGESLAVVVDISPVGDADLRVSARNAETLTAILTDVAMANRDALELTVGGPTTNGSMAAGRSRQIPAHLDMVASAVPVTGIRRAATGVRSKVGALKRRVT